MYRRGIFGSVGLWLALSLLALPVIAASNGPVSGVDLVPFSAIYDLKLDRADQGGSVVDMAGRYAVEFGDACEGFTTTQRLVSRMTNAEGESTVSDYLTTSVESKDGLQYRFTVRQETDSQRSSDLVGQAKLNGRGKAGTVKITRPAEEEIELPLGAVFPTEHTARLIAAGGAGKSSLVLTVYDASTDDGLYDVSAFIGKTKPGEKFTDDLHKGLSGLRSWPVRLAYFPAEAKAERPLYEVGFRLYENGISDDIVLDYGDFALKAVLVKLDLGKPPKC